MNKVSVITIVYNDAQSIRATLDSFFAQTWQEKELIVVDGGSTDGTAAIIGEYADKITWWCSEPDKGIYDALNKGISHCTGDWINVLNCGDFFNAPTVLEDIFSSSSYDSIDVIYGDSIEYEEGARHLIQSSSNLSLMSFIPVYRHGSSFVRRDVQERFLYDVSQSQRYGYALDWHMIHRMYKAGVTFQRIDTIIQMYCKEGASDNLYQNIKYNYRIVTDHGSNTVKTMLFFTKKYLLTLFVSTKCYVMLRAFLLEFLVNSVLPHCHCWCFRRWCLKRLGTKIDKGAFIMKNTYFMNANLLELGAHSHINRGCTIDARGRIKIGENVSISHGVSIFTGSHNYKSSDFYVTFNPVVIDDFAWLGANCTILPGVHIGKGAVVCAGAVVNHDVPAYTVVGGVPAKEIGTRPQELHYTCNGYQPFT